MCCQWFHRAVVVAMLTGPAGIVPCPVTAGEPVTPFDAPRSAVETQGLAQDSDWLTPDAAFRPASPEPSVVAPTLPLLRIPAAQTFPSIVNPFSDDGSPDNDGTRGAGSHAEATENAPSMAQDQATSQTVGKPNGADAAQHGLVIADLQKLGESPSQMIDNLPRLVVMTLVVLATCFGTLMLARRWLMKSGFVNASQRNSRLQIVASLSIGPRSQLHIVRLDDREVLVGVDSRGLQQMQLVPPSFEAVLQSSQPQDAAVVTLDKSNEARSTQHPPRMFAAA